MFTNPNLQAKLNAALIELKKKGIPILGIYTCTITIEVPHDMQKYHHKLSTESALYDAVKSSQKILHLEQNATNTNPKKVDSGYMIEFNHSKKCFAIIHTEKPVTKEFCQQLGAKLVEKGTTKKAKAAHKHLVEIPQVKEEEVLA